MSRTLDATRPLLPFVQPTRRDYAIAAEIVDSQSVVSAHAAVEWDCFHEDGQTHLAAIVREAQRRARLTGERVVEANVFLGWMADRFRQRTARRLLGLPWWMMSRQVAMEHALIVFDNAVEDMPFGHPDGAWDRAGAEALVDEELSYWEA